MKENSKLTPVEWEIMEAVWSIGGEPTIRDVLEFAFPKGEKAYTTVQTMMNILVNKGLLQSEKIGLVNFYTPIKTRDEIVNIELSNVVSKFFKGSAPALTHHLITSKDFTQEDIKAIKKLLVKKEIEIKGKNHDRDT